MNLARRRRIYVAWSEFGPTSNEHKHRQLHSDAHRDTPIDMFVTEPFDFEHECREALVVDVAPGRSVHVVRLETFLRMEEEAGRPRDIADAAELRHLHRSDDA